MGLIVPFLWTACTKRTSSEPVYTDYQRLQLDTTGNHTKNIDSLLFFVRKYQKLGDRAREMAAYAELGHSFQTSSRYSEAIKAHQRQLSIAEELGDTLMKASALNDLGVNCRRMGLYYDALDYHLRAVETSFLYAEEEANEKILKCRAIGHNGAGNAYLTVGHYQKADEQLRKALAVETRLGSHLGMNVDYSNLGLVYEHRGVMDTAHLYFERAVYHSKKAGSTTGLAYGYMNFGRLAQKSADYDKAIQHFRYSMSVINRHRDLWLWLQPCIALAGAYVEVGQLDSAHHYLDEALSTARRIGTKEYHPQILRLYGDYYSKQGQHALALDYHLKAKQAEDSLLDARNLFEIDKLQNDIALRQQEKQQALADAQLQSERLMKWLFVSAFTLLLGVSLMLWYIAHVRWRTNRMQRKLIEMRETFFTNITHELRTPLTVILGMSNSLKEESTLCPCHREQVQVIERQGQRLLDLINQLLDISKIKTAVGQADWRCGNITAHITMIVEAHREFARNKQIVLQYFPKAEVTMNFVPEYLNKLLGNLLSNAFKFTPEYGRVSLTLWRESQRLYLEVSDTGVGIPQESLPHLFEPFYQAQTDKKFLGTGVGLALVKQILSVIDGKISVESTVGSGTTFRLSLPIHYSSQLPAPMIEAKPQYINLVQPEMPLQDCEEGGETRVLVIEDNHDVAGYIGQLLSKSYAVYYANDGQQGLQKAIEIVPDIIITDLMMPEMDGLELCQQVRANEVVNHVPIIVVSAKISEEDRVKGLAAGADAYLAKPFNSDELCTRVETLLAGRRLLREKWARDFKQTPEEAQRGNACCTGQDNDFLHKVEHNVRKLIDEHKTVEVNALAMQLCMSYSQFRRKIFALTGHTAQGYIQGIKLKRAQELIVECPEMPYKEVAERCGYSEYSNFVRAFKNTYGVSPGKYVKTD